MIIDDQLQELGHTADFVCLQRMQTFHLQVRFGPLARVRLDRVVKVVDATWKTWHRGVFFLCDLKLNLVEPLQIPQRFSGKGLCYPLMFDAVCPAKAERVVAEGHQWEEAQELRPLTPATQSTLLISGYLR